MPPAIQRFTEGVPRNFLAALLVSFCFMAFLVIDQAHWWQLKPDYAFGWLVPLFTGFIIYDRWSKLKPLLADGRAGVVPFWIRGSLDVLASISLAAGLGCFLFGALYRAGMGTTQPGSLALAIGFSLLLPAMIYFNVPRSSPADSSAAASAAEVFADARIRAVGLFLFPALIWIISAPLVSAVENAISLFCLRRVVDIVFTVFSLLGYPLIQEGNVLVLPIGRVGVVDACSGIRSLTGCLFAGAFLSAVYLDRTWKKISLILAALLLAFLTNLLRSFFLTGWAYAYGSHAIEGNLHDVTGYAVLGVTVVGLFCLLPLFDGKNWRRWLQLPGGDELRAQSSELRVQPKG